MMLKLKFTWNSAILDVMNSGLETVIFDPKEMLGILDLRSMGYCKIKQGILQHNLSKYYRFESADTLCERFNRFINTLKNERTEERQEIYPWIDPSNKRKYMSDRKILEEHKDLENSFLTEKEKIQVVNMLYIYKKAFSLRDEIGTCPKIEVEMDVTDKSPFLLDCIMSRKKIKFYRQRNEETMLFRNIKGRNYSLFQANHAN